MIIDFNFGSIEVLLGDITQLPVDCVVNAANESLLGGGGVDGAIHRVAGPELLAECTKLNGCKTGGAKITKGYNLSAPYIIHTVGPRWNSKNLSNEDKEQLLQKCYVNSLKLASKYGVSSIAFPCISTGIFKFPKVLATHIAVMTAVDLLENNSNTSVNHIVFCCFEPDMYELYIDKLSYFL